MYLSVSEAAKLVNRSTTSIKRAIQDGRLTATKNNRRHYRITQDDLYRAFPNRGESEASTGNNTNIAGDLMGYMADWQRRYDDQAEKYESEIDELREQFDSLQELKDSAAAEFIAKLEAKDQAISDLQVKVEQSRELQTVDNEKARVREQEWFVELKKLREQLDTQKRRADDDLDEVREHYAKELETKEAVWMKQLDALADKLTPKPKPGFFRRLFSA